MVVTPAFVLKLGEAEPTNHPTGAAAASGGEVAAAVAQLQEQLPESERRAAAENLQLFELSGCRLTKGAGNNVAKLLSGAHLYVFPEYSIYCTMTTEFVVNYAEAESDGEVVGFMDLHDDDFEADLRGMGTIGGKDEQDSKIKTMTFEDVETKERDTITIPHGTVVVLDRVAAGAVKEFKFKHGIEDAEGTYTYGIQMNIKKSGKSG